MLRPFVIVTPPASGGDELREVGAGIRDACLNTRLTPFPERVFVLDADIARVVEIGEKRHKSIPIHRTETG